MFVSVNNFATHCASIQSKQSHVGGWSSIRRGRDADEHVDALDGKFPRELTSTKPTKPAIPSSTYICVHNERAILLRHAEIRDSERVSTRRVPAASTQRGRCPSSDTRCVATNAPTFPTDCNSSRNFLHVC